MRDWWFLLLVIPAVAGIVFFGGVYSWVWAPLAIWLIALMAVLIFRRLRRNQSIPVHPLLLPIGAYGLIVFLQVIFGKSQYPGETITGLAQLTACGGIFYASLILFRRPDRIVKFGRLGLILCLAVAVEAILQKLTAGDYIYWFHDARYASPSGPFVYHNHFAGCMELLIPLAAAVGWPKHPSGIKVFNALLVPVLGLAAVVLAQSRGGLVVILAELVIGLVFFWRSLFGENRHSRRIFVIAGSATILVLLVLTNWSPLIARLGNLGHRDASLSERLQIDEGGWRIWHHYPVWGTGFATFETVYPRYAVSDSRNIVNYAHNDYLQALVETGLMGGIAVLLFLGLYLYSFPRSTSCSRRVLVIKRAAFIGTWGLLLHAWGDFQFHAEGIALLFFLLAGLVAAEVRPGAMDARGRNRRHTHHAIPTTSF